MALVQISSSNFEAGAINSTELATSTALVVSRTSSQEISVSPAIERIWRRECSTLTQADQERYASLACNGFDAYLEAMVAECQTLKDDSVASDMIKWLEPLYKIAEAVSPIANVAAASAGVPLPTDLILCSIRGVLNLTKAIPDIQIRAIQLLRQMGRKARILDDYIWLLSRDEPNVQEALIIVYSDIAMFCHDVGQFFGRNGKSSIRNFFHKTKMSISNKFSEDLAKHITKFENDLQDFQERAAAVHLKKTQQTLDAFERQLNKDDEYKRTLEKLRDDKYNAAQSNNAQKERRRARIMFEKCISWASELDFNREYLNRCEDHLDGTCQWFLTSEKYCHWKQSDQSELLWVQGNPGSGKSMLSAVAIHDLRNRVDPGIGVAFAFCQRKQQSKQTIAAIIGAMTRQLLEGRDTLSESVRKTYIEKAKRGRSIEDATALDLLNLATDMYDHVYLIIDAVDEFQNPQKLLKSLGDILDNHRLSRVLKILVLSRTNTDVDDLLDSTYQPICPEVENQADIRLYIESKLPGDEHAKARALCLDKARGMFQWVVLLFQEFNVREGNSEDVLGIINDLNPGLDSMYDHIFQEISLRSPYLRDRAWLVLFWILDGYRPLMVDELQEAVGGYKEVKKVSDIKKHSTARSLVELCKNLIYVDRDGCFSFIHESVRLYLEKANTELNVLKEFQAKRKDSHDKLATICLDYLNLEDFDEVVYSVHELRLLLRACRFGEYAARYWGHHVANGKPELHQDKVINFVRSTARRVLSLHVTLYHTSSSDELWAYPESTSELHCIALFNLPSIGAALLERTRTSGYHKDGAGKTPITYAAEHSSEDMVLWLLDIMLKSTNQRARDADLAGATLSACYLGWNKVLIKVNDINPGVLSVPLKDPDSTPFIVTCLAGNEDAAKCLISLGVDLSLSPSDGTTGLIAATAADMTTVLELILQKHPDSINMQDDEGSTALHYAATNNKETSIIALMDHGANPTIRTFLQGNTPAHHAAAGDSAMALHKIQLYRPEFDFRSKNTVGNTPLHVAAAVNAHKAVKALIDVSYGVSLLDEVNNKNETAVAIAARVNAVETAKLLVQAKCSLVLVDEGGSTALHLAARKGHYHIVSTIVEGADSRTLSQLLSSRTNEKDTALHLACMAGCRRSIEILLAKGADPFARGSWNDSTLHYAASHGNGDIVDAIMRYTKDANPRNESGDHPLHFATSKRNHSFVQRYIEICKELDLKLEVSSLNEYQVTPLFLAVKNNDRFLIDLLLPLTSSSVFDVRSSDDNLLIHYVAWHGNEPLMRKLLESQQLNIKGYKGRTPLHQAIIAGQLEMVKLLLPLSDLEARDENGHTALLLALSANKLAIARHVLMSKPDIHATTDLKEGALQFAARTGNSDIFDELLLLGCRSFAANVRGESPLHWAALCGPVSMIESLQEHGFNNFQSPDQMGHYADFYAAEMGRLDVFGKLRSLNVPLGLPDKNGYTAVHQAAQQGHVNVLKYLRSHNVDIFLPSNDGNTPFLLAAKAGYPTVARYLLDSRPESINDHLEWNEETGMISAISWSHYETAYHIGEISEPAWLVGDAFGITAKDLYARQNGLDGTSRSQVTQEEHPLAHGVEQELKVAVVKKCLDRLNAHLAVDIKLDGRSVALALQTLSSALRFIGDFDAMKLCKYPHCFEEEGSILGYPPACDGCYRSYWAQSVFICETCYFTNYLCQTCYNDYIESDRGCPALLIELLALEEDVRNVRNVCEEIEDIFMICIAVNYFRTGQNYVAKMLASYEEWEQRSEAEKHYTNLERPGYQWLKLLQEFSDFIYKADFKSNAEQASRKKVADFRWRYDIFRHRFKADKECIRFRCKGHNYVEATRSHYNELKSAGDLYDSTTGMIKDELLKRIAVKYSLSPAAVDVEHDNQSAKAMSEHFSSIRSSITEEKVSSTTSEVRIVSDHLTETISQPTELILTGRSRQLSDDDNGNELLVAEATDADTSTATGAQLGLRHLLKTTLQSIDDYDTFRQVFGNRTTPDIENQWNIASLLRPDTNTELHPYRDLDTIKQPTVRAVGTPVDFAVNETDTKTENPSASHSAIPKDQAAILRDRAAKAAQRRLTSGASMMAALLDNEKSENDRLYLRNALLVTNAIQPGFGLSYIEGAYARLKSSTGTTSG